MTDNAPARDLAWVPDACTLPTVGPQHLRLMLTGPADVEATVADLAARENQCCSSFTFTTSAAPGQVTFDIQVPAPDTGVLDSLAQRANQAAGVS